MPPISFFRKCNYIDNEIYMYHGHIFKKLRFFSTALRALCFSSLSFAKGNLGDLFSGDIKMEDGG